MQQYIGSRRRTPKALEDVKKFVEWSITSVLLPDYEQDTKIQEIWEATESLKPVSYTHLTLPTKRIV